MFPLSYFSPRIVLILSSPLLPQSDSSPPRRDAAAVGTRCTSHATHRRKNLSPTNISLFPFFCLARREFRTRHDSQDVSSAAGPWHRLSSTVRRQGRGKRKGRRRLVEGQKRKNEGKWEKGERVTETQTYLLSSLRLVISMFFRGTRVLTIRLILQTVSTSEYE